MADEGLTGAAGGASEPAPSPSPATGSGRAALVHVFGLLLVLIVGALARLAVSAPPVVPATAPVEVFSAERAMKHVRELGKAPHPVGSRGHDDARDLVLARLRELGLEPTVQKTHTTQTFFGRTSGAVVENVVARVRGRGGDPRAILFSAHYDAVPQSFGAGDDGSGVAALLEGARAVVQGPPLDRDVLFLFTDAEELGLLGASAFVAESPLAKDVIADFNFDARGTRGPLAMFDTSNQNGALIALLSRVPHVQASSFVSALAKLLPNDTDATIFKKAGVPTMSFAFADEVENYHRATDSPERLDPRSVQAMGDVVVSIARDLGRGPLPVLEGDDVAYVTLAGSKVLPVPYASALGAAAVGALVVAFATWLAIRRRVASAKGVLVGAGASLGSVLLAGLAGAGLHVAASRAASVDALMVRSGSLAWAALSVALLVGALTARVAGRRAGARSTSLGAAALLSLVGLAVAIAAPSASLAFVATGLAAVLPALGIALLGTRGATVRIAFVYAAASVSLFFWVPLLYSVTVAAAAQAALPVAVLAMPTIVLVAPLATMPRTRSMLLFAGVCVTIVVAAFLHLAFPLGDAVPQRSTLAYGVDADRKQGFYYGSEPRPWMAPALTMGAGETTRRPLPELTLSDTEVYVGRAEVSGLVGLTVEKSERKRIGEGFEIRATLRPSSADVRCLWLFDESDRIASAAAVNEKPVRQLVRFSPEKDAELARRMRIGGVRPGFALTFCAMHGEPLEVVLHTREEGPVSVRLVEIIDGLPPAAGGAPLARPSGEIATDVSDRTVVGKTVRL